MRGSFSLALTFYDRFWPQNWFGSIQPCSFENEDVQKGQKKIKKFNNSFIRVMLDSKMSQFGGKKLVSFS